MKLIILPHQLYKNIPNSIDEVIIIEHPYYFTRYKFHKLKLAFHISTMRNYSLFCKNKKIKTRYINVVGYNNWKNSSHDNHIIYDPVDNDVKTEFTKMNIKIIDSSNFLIKEKFLKQINYKRFSAFYNIAKNHIKNEYNLDFRNLVSMDKYNRKSMKKNQINNYSEDLNIYKLNYNDKYSINYVNKQYSTNFGELNEYNMSLLPKNFSQAKMHLKIFIKEHFKEFGPYQDFITREHIILNHSHISFLLNCGLLTPLQVLKEIIKVKHKISPESYEGFFRQIIWREYMGYIYTQHYNDIKDANFWNNKNKLNWDKFYGYIPTGIYILDNEIQKIKTYAYSHHIVRLMVFLNYFILTEINPKDVIQWFTECISLDAYDWVMQSNIRCMGYYSNKFTSKPYFSSGNYLKKMSNYEIEDKWSILYRKFIQKKHHLKFYR